MKKTLLTISFIALLLLNSCSNGSGRSKHQPQPDTTSGRSTPLEKTDRSISLSEPEYASRGDDTTGRSGESPTGGKHKDEQCTEEARPLKNSIPMVITKRDNGRTFGNLRISNPRGACLTIEAGTQNIKIEYSLFNNCKKGISIQDAKNISISGNRFENVVTAVEATLSRNIQVDYNEFVNIGFTLLSDGVNANFVEFSKVRGSNNSISYNIGENLPGKSDPEDIISIYKSHGDPGAPIRIVGNKFRGRGPSESGSGIMTGDVGGSYILVKNNILVDAGQVGIGIAGGEHISVIGNTLFHSNNSAYFSTGGMYVWAVSTEKCRNAPETCSLKDRWNWNNRLTNGCYYCALPCGHHTVKNNHVNWWSSMQNRRIAWWDQGNCSEGNTIENNPGFETLEGDTNVNAAILPENLFDNTGPRYFSYCH